MGTVVRQVRAGLEVAWAGVALAAVILIVIVLVHASEPTPNLTSALDGLDPVQSECAGKGGRDVAEAGSPSLRDPAGVVIGRVYLVQSIYCGTRWARFTLAAEAAQRLKGRAVEVVVRREADDRIESYRLPLRGGQVGFGNMLAVSGSCVEASVRLLAQGDQDAGPTARTACR